jgi:hypothetical protein
LDGLKNSTASEKKTERKQMRKKLPKLAKICDRYGISDRAGAVIATAVLEDLGIVSQSTPTNVVDRYKLRRERELTRKCTMDTAETHDSIQTLYYDGRKDRTLKLEKRAVDGIPQQLQKNTLLS